MANFERIHQISSHDMYITEFYSFCKRVHDIIDYKKQFVIYRFFLQKEKSVEKRKEFFISHCKTFSAAFNSLSAMNDVRV